MAGIFQEDFSAIIDLGKETSISQVEAGFHQYSNLGFFYQKKFVFISLDGEKFEEIAKKVKNDTLKKLQKERSLFSVLALLFHLLVNIKQGI